MINIKYYKYNIYMNEELFNEIICYSDDEDIDLEYSDDEEDVSIDWLNNSVDLCIFDDLTIEYDCNELNKNDLSFNIYDDNIEMDDEQVPITYYYDLKKHQVILNTKQICCLCGVEKVKHSRMRHKYFQIEESYRCKKCGLFFFQHNHCKNPCFSPFKYIN